MTILVACSDKRGSNWSPDVWSLDKQSQSLGNNDVICADQSYCLEAIAKTVSAVSFGKIRSCTSFLVSSDIMATTASCLESDFRQTNIDCSNKLKSFFPETQNRPAESVACKKIIAVSQLDRNGDPAYWGRDFVFFQLAHPVDREFISANTSGISEFEKLTAWYLADDGKNVVVTKAEGCQAIYGSYINPLSTRPFYPTMIFGNCPVDGLVAGAALINSDGLVAGIASAKLETDLIESVWNRFFKHMVDNQELDKYRVQDEMGKIIYGTNFSCLPSVTQGNSKNNVDCHDFNGSFEREFAVNKARTNFVQSSQIRINGEYELCTEIEAMATEIRDAVEDKLLFDLNLKFVHHSHQKDFFKVECSGKEYTLSPTFTANIVFEPSCFNNISSWKNQYKRSGKDRFASSARMPKDGAVAISDIGVKMNNFLKLEYYTIPSFDLSFEFSPKHLFGHRNKSNVILQNGHEFKDISPCK